MNRELAAKATSLRNLALQYERGDLDAEFAAHCDVPIADLRLAVVTRIRRLADTIEGRAE